MKNHIVGGLLVLVTACASAQTDTTATYAITIHDHRFEPATLELPAGQRVKISITNARKVPAEFESASMRVERVLPADTTMNVWVGPLGAGTYAFFDDFNPGTRGTAHLTAPG